MPVSPPVEQTDGSGGVLTPGIAPTLEPGHPLVSRMISLLAGCPNCRESGERPLGSLICRNPHTVF